MARFCVLLLASLWSVAQQVSQAPRAVSFCRVAKDLERGKPWDSKVANSPRILKTAWTCEFQLGVTR